MLYYLSIPKFLAFMSKLMQWGQWWLWRVWCLSWPHTESAPRNLQGFAQITQRAQSSVGCLERWEGCEQSRCLTGLYLDAFSSPGFCALWLSRGVCLPLSAVLGRKVYHVLFLIWPSINTSSLCGPELNALARNQLSQEERDQLHYNTTCRFLSKLLVLFTVGWVGGCAVVHITRQKHL